MGKFRKKPTEIEAVQFDGVEIVDDTPTPMFDGSFDPPQEWLQKALTLHERELGAIYNDGDKLKIHTLEGCMIASPGDFIIFGVIGEIYPCKPDIFASTYEVIQP